MNSIHVISCVDKNYLQHLGALTVSLFENKTCSNNIIYHIVHDELSESDKALFAGIEKKYHATVVFHDIAHLYHKYEHIVANERYPYAALHRLLISEIFPPEIKKVLYLDCDIIINGDISGLWNIDINNYVTAAVEDAVPFSRHPVLMMPEKSLYFNSGVLLINLEKWTHLGITDKTLKFMMDFPESCPYPDQDALNAILYNDWLRLPPKYNQQSALHYLPGKRLVYSKTEYAEALKCPVIIHYTGVIKNTKPWHYIDVHPLKKYYYKYLTITPPHGIRMWLTHKTLKMFL